MSSMSRSPSAASTKICSACGRDVSQAKRYKDESGTYYCAPCWPKASSDAGKLPEQMAAQRKPAAVPEELLFCEGCGGRFAPKYLRLENQRVLCVDCLAERRRRATASAGVAVRPHIREIAVAQRRLMWAILLGVIAVPLFPLLLIAVPLQIYRTARLASCLGSNPLVWGVGACVPYVGLLVLLVLNAQATSTLKAAGIPVGLMGAKLPR